VTKELQKRKLISPKYVPYLGILVSRDMANTNEEREKGRKRRAKLTNRKHIHYSITKGPQFALEVKQLETDLTVEMLASYVPFLLFPTIPPSLLGLLSLEANFVTVSLAIPAGSELTRSGAWKDASFKNYNFAAAGQLPEGGALHPLLKMREEMRQIFFDMGYVFLLLFHSSILLVPFQLLSRCSLYSSKETREEGEEVEDSRYVDQS
jgi:hypothetical protein